jgi:hypothetical protein
MIWSAVAARGAGRSGPRSPDRDRTGRLERYRSRFVYKAMDAALTSDLGAPFREGGTEAVPAEAGSPAFRRARRLANFLTSVLPQPLTSYLEKGFDPSRLPFRADRVELLGFGSGSTVYLVRFGRASEVEPLVLKIWRKSLGLNLGELQRQADARRHAYRTIARWYSGSDAVLPTHFLILHGPVLAGRAVACVQPLLRRGTLDLFDDIGERDLVRMLVEHPPLRSHFVLFVERTLHFARTEGACVDIAGHGNVVLEARSRLRLLDYGIFDFAVKEVRQPEAIPKIRKRLAYLERVMKGVRSGSGLPNSRDTDT